MNRLYSLWSPWQLRVILGAAMALGLISAATWWARRERGREGPGAVAARLDLNRATAAELEALPGMTPRQAAAIVQYRRTSGPFVRIEDLNAVPGVGADAIRHWAPNLHVGPEAGSMHGTQEEHSES